VALRPEELLDALGAFRRTLRRHVGSPLSPPLTSAQVELVRVVRRKPGISVAESAEKLGVAPNTVSTLVGQLSDARVLVRRVDGDDRRVARLDLVPEVRRKVDAWRDRRTVVLNQAFNRLSQADRRRLDEAVPALERLARELDRS
jgi:DNA-binding MarR family transcriptional regulator